MKTAKKRGTIERDRIQKNRNKRKRKRKTKNVCLLFRV